MDDNDKKEESERRISTLLDRMPIMDGGGRRRLTAGTIVVLTTILVFEPLRTGLTTVIVNKDISLSLLLAAAGLLIYATGVVVELLGEVFLARAVSNAAWSFVAATHYARRWRGFHRPIAWVFILIVGVFGGFGYFILGLFGASKWRMQPMLRLSESGQQLLESQPPAIRDSIEKALAVKADFGRKAIIDQLRDPESRRWARRLMDRPKDVLALVSALLISLFVYLGFAPYTYTLSSQVRTDLAQSRAMLVEAKTSTYAQMDADDMPILRVLTQHTLLWGARIGDIGKPKSVQDLIDAFSGWNIAVTFLANLASPLELGNEGIGQHIPGEPLLLAASASPGDVESSLDWSFGLIDSFCALNVNSMKGYGVDDNNPEYAQISTLLARMLPVCKRLLTSKTFIENSFLDADNEIRRSIRPQFALRTAAVFTALFLFVAFFNTLTASTVSVLEMLALQETVRKAKDSAAVTPPVQTLDSL
jgi:hypothetical protein